MPTFDEIFDDADFAFDPTIEVEGELRDGRRAALEDALSRVDDLDDCWTVFRQAVTESILDSVVVKEVVSSSRKQVARSILASEYDRLVNIAANKLISRDRATVLTEAAKLMLLEPSAQSEAKHLAVALLRDQLKTEVRTEVREQLKEDPAFVDEVKRELKRKIMGI
jgi:hypothetical protein